MDKRRATYDLARIRAAFVTPERLSATMTAFRDARALGFGPAGIVGVIQSMRRAHFYKSMTSHTDARVWQDVYHVPVGELVLYVKFTEDRLTAFRLLSFKER